MADTNYVDMYDYTKDKQGMKDSWQAGRDFVNDNLKGVDKVIGLGVVEMGSSLTDTVSDGIIFNRADKMQDAIKDIMNGDGKVNWGDNNPKPNNSNSQGGDTTNTNTNQNNPPQPSGGNSNTNQGGSTTDNGNGTTSGGAQTTPPNGTTTTPSSNSQNTLGASAGSQGATAGTSTNSDSGSVYDISDGQGGTIGVDSNGNIVYNDTNLGGSAGQGNGDNGNGNGQGQGSGENGNGDNANNNGTGKGNNTGNKGDSNTTDTQDNNSTTPKPKFTQEEIDNINRQLAELFEIEIYDPIVLDLNKDGKISITNSNTYFDYDGDNIKEAGYWVDKTDGFLAIDKNNNGIIDNASELFGNFSPNENGELAKDGFEALSSFDTNKDGVVDENDKNFEKLVVWQDENIDGISSANELKTLKELGIKSINLTTQDINEKSLGNTLTKIGSYTSDDGSENIVADMEFSVDPSDTKLKIK